MTTALLYYLICYQTATFEAERQAFYDNEQHLKSRIQSLTQARKQPIPPSPSAISVAESEVEVEVTPPEPQPSTKQDMSDPQQEPAEMTALKLELTTLSTSHASLYATVQLLQGQLNDLKRVNNELQEENESYNILLREKTLNGQFDILRMGGARSERQSESPIPEEDDEVDRDADSLGSRDTGRSSRSVLDPVHEHPEEHEEEEIQVDAPELDPQFGQVEDGDVEEPGTARNPRSRHSRRRSSVAAPQGESLANLPITGPGLDLAAELGRAENKDILDGHASLDAPVNGDNKARKHKPSGADSGHKGRTGADGTLEPSTSSTNELDTLRSEVKSLKDANKALSLYASKIIDRIISQEGFEHVLAIDYEKSPTPSTTTFSPRPPPSPVKKARPQSAMFSRSTPATASNSPNIPPPERLTTFESLNANAAQQQSSPEPPKAAPSSRASRRSLSFDWASFSMFGGDKKAASPANLRPLTLTAGKPVVTGARKLDTYEDEEDRRERERLNATMKLMGIEKAPSPSSPLPPMLKSFSTPGAVGGTPTTPVVAAPTPTSSRFSFFRRSSSNNTNSETPSFNSSPGNSRSSSTVPHLTQETLEQAEAESTLAALDAHERQLSAEIAKGAGSGFTEIVRRGGDRRSSRRSGSGSTVWSAGMSKHEDED